MPSVLRWTSRISSLVGVLLLALAFASPAAGWGSSVHHDQAIIISDALKDSPSIPADVQENICSDTIYAASLAPDDWRNVTGEWGTWQYNMAENAYYEFQRIRDAWAYGDFDNAIARIGIVLHYVGDALDMKHSGGPSSDHNNLDGVRDWYMDYIAPLGSEDPLWEEGKHHTNQQMEAYTDSDSAWYPRQPENYGPTDNGSLDWFLDYFYDPAIDDDSPANDYGTVIGRHLRETSPYVDWAPADNPGDNDDVDNRWFYWVETRDADIPKMDADNTIRLTYNGVYRALRDGEYWRQNVIGASTPADWGYWPWPTTTAWESSRPYGNGYDVVRWNEGQSERGFSGEESEQGAAVQGGAEAVAIQILLIVAGSAVAAIGISYAWRRWRGRKPKPALKKRRRRS